MNPEKINALGQVLVPLATIVTAICGAYAMRVKLRLAELRAQRDQRLERDRLAEIAPLAFLVLLGAAWANLFSQNPQLARMLPAFDPDAFAAAAPGPLSAASCKSASECATGCKCTGGECTPCSARKPVQPPPQKSKPRLVATIGEGTLCADCMRLPQMITSIAQPFAD
jgi:hypothetical protein